MKWLKYRQNSRASQGEWEYHPFFEDDMTEEVLIEMYGDIMSFLQDNGLLEYRSYEYRIDYEVIDAIDVPEELIQKQISRCENVIRFSKRQIIYYQRLLLDRLTKEEK